MAAGKSGNELTGRWRMRYGVEWPSITTEPDVLRAAEAESCGKSFEGQQKRSSEASKSSDLNNARTIENSHEHSMPRGAGAQIFPAEANQLRRGLPVLRVKAMRSCVFRSPPRVSRGPGLWRTLT